MKIGDVVRLKSGGPAMTVTAGTSGPPEMATVQWFHDDSLCTAVVPVAALATEPQLSVPPPAGDDCIGAYIERVYQLRNVAGDPLLLERQFTDVRQMRGKKGPFVSFTTGEGRVGFWPNAANGPFIKAEK